MFIGLVVSLWLLMVSTVSQHSVKRHDVQTSQALRSCEQRVALACRQEEPALKAGR